MTMEELRRLSRDVEWVVQQGPGAERDDDGAFEENARHFRELVARARNALVLGHDVEPPVALAIRALSAVILEG